MAPKSNDDEDEETAVAISSELLKDGNSGVMVATDCYRWYIPNDPSFPSHSSFVAFPQVFGQIRLSMDMIRVTGASWRMLALLLMSPNLDRINMKGWKSMDAAHLTQYLAMPWHSAEHWNVNASWCHELQVIKYASFTGAFLVHCMQIHFV